MDRVVMIGLHNNDAPPGLQRALFRESFDGACKRKGRCGRDLEFDGPNPRGEERGC